MVHKKLHLGFHFFLAIVMHWAEIFFYSGCSGTFRSLRYSYSGSFQYITDWNISPSCILANFQKKYYSNKEFAGWEGCWLTTRGTQLGCHDSKGISGKWSGLCPMALTKKASPAGTDRRQTQRALATTLPLGSPVCRCPGRWPSGEYICTSDGANVSDCCSCRERSAFLHAPWGQPPDCFWGPIKKKKPLPSLAPKRMSLWGCQGFSSLFKWETHCCQGSRCPSSCDNLL